ncbi:MAG: hypothetical protein ACRDA8_14940 [Shewanella sp.]
MCHKGKYIGDSRGQTHAKCSLSLAPTLDTALKDKIKRLNQELKLSA